MNRCRRQSSIIIFIFLPLALLAQSPQHASKSTDPVYAPLWLYSGSWKITRNNLSPGAKPDELVNQCTLIGKYFACQQTVNGSVAELLIFVPGSTPGRYHTQSVLPSGRAGGLGELQISGDRWIFSSSYNPGGSSVYVRTTNQFQDKNHIHFEQAESTDNQQWVVKNSGDEVRVSAAH